MAKKKSVFTCQECGYQSPKYLGRCPNCSAWSSFVEEVEVQEVKNAQVSLNGEKSRPTKLKDVSSINYSRTKTDMDEFNRVLGGGVVPGSLVLIGGDPGIGDSDIMMTDTINPLKSKFKGFHKTFKQDDLGLSLSSFLLN